MAEIARRRADHQPFQRGLTLVELLLVLTLLVVIGAFTAPLLNGVYARVSLQNGGELLRAALSRARFSAVEAGEPFVFRCEQKGSRYQIIKLDELGMPEAEELAPDDPDVEHHPADMMRLGLARIPDGVIFAGAEVASSNQLAATIGPSSSEVWSEPILFHPDGAATDASLLLANGQGQTLRVTLRGVTGISHAGDVGREVIP